MVPGAAVIVVSEETGFRRQTQSQANGGYVVASLQPGVYKITVRKEGFRTLVRFGVRLNAAQPGRVDFTLPLGNMQEVITVSATPPAVNAEDASVGTLISRERFESLPLSGRGLLALIELAPGAIATPATRGEAGQFTVNGQRPNAHYFMVDGASANTGVSAGGLPAHVTGGSLPGMTALGTLHGVISLEALDEFRIQTSTATPEFGRLPGAQVLLSSRSGSNEFHGSLFHYFRNHQLDASSWFANRTGDPDSPLVLNDFGVTLGGPVRRNRTFFFLSWEELRLREPFAWRSPVPSAEARSEAPEWVRPALELFPDPNGRSLGTHLAEWSGVNNRRARLDTVSLRLDHALTARLTAFARMTAAPSSNLFTRTQVADLRINAPSLTAGVNLRIRSNAILDLKVNRSWALSRSYWRAADAASNPLCALGSVTQYLYRTENLCDHLFRISIAGMAPATAGPEPVQRQNHWQAAPTASLTVGTHQFRLGADYRRYAPERRDQASSLGLIAESFNNLFVGRNLWVSLAPARTLRGTLAEASVFAQDTWRIHPQVTATFGMRWEHAKAPRLIPPEEESSQWLAYAFPGQSRAWRSRRADFAPRAGLAYQPGKNRRFVLRGGWGLFYDSTLSIATDLVNGGPFSISQFTQRGAFLVSSVMSYGFASDLRLPNVQQWNATLERGLTRSDLISLSYVGSTGRRLLRREFADTGTQTVWLALATNHGESSYHSLHVQYRRPMVRGLQALASWAWSHSIDNSSSDSLLHRAGTGMRLQNDRGSSDFDVQHTFTAALSYAARGESQRTLWGVLRGGWALDGILRTRTGFPITVLNSEYAMGLSFVNAFRPDLVGGKPVWLTDRSVPGGRRLNSDAFRATAGLLQGTLGRNAIRGFGMHQIDLAVHRQFSVWRQSSIQFRVEAFNLLNHPNFADPERFLSSPLFGGSLSMLNLMLGTGSPASGLTPLFQPGGARSVQIALRWRF
jgi:hypothetical protein